VTVTSWDGIRLGDTVLERFVWPNVVAIEGDVLPAVRIVVRAERIERDDLGGVIAESVLNRTLRAVHERRRGFEDAREFVDGISGRKFARFWYLTRPVHETSDFWTPL